MQTTQHSRIELVSATEVRVQRNQVPGLTSLYVLNGHGELEDKPDYPGTRDGHYICTFDKDGDEARALVGACWRQTGSFAALDDGSAVPFIGKQVRSTNDTLNPVIDGDILEVVDMIGNGNLGLRSVKSRMGMTCALSELLPLARAPQYRPYTLTEAAPFAEQDRELLFHGKRWVLHSLTKTHVRLWEVNNDDAAHLTYGDLVGQGTWADDKTPVGVLVTANEGKE